MENEEAQVVEINPKTQPIAYAQQTRAEKLKTDSYQSDFAISPIQSVDAVFSESFMSAQPEVIQNIIRESGIKSSVGQQTLVAIENALDYMNQAKDETRISYGNVSNYLTGNKIGDELAQIAYESMKQRYNEMALNEEAVGGIRSELAKLVGGATSFTQLALEGLATFGALPLAHIGVQAFGQGVYNDMKAYEYKHGSLKGYKPEGYDLAVNTANALLQVGIESAIGVGSPRFLVGASRGAFKEGLSGALQEPLQDILSDLTEAAKGNQDISILLDNAEDYTRSSVIGGVLQGLLGAVTGHQHYARAVDSTAKAIAKTKGREEPNAEDKSHAKSIIDAKERQYASILTKEFKSAFDASSGEGQLQQKIAKELNKAVKYNKLDLGTTDETQLAQKIEGIATQQTLNAMDMAKEKGLSVAEMEMNNIAYKDNTVWIEGKNQQEIPIKDLVVSREEREEIRDKIDEIISGFKEEGVELKSKKMTKSGKRPYVSRDGAAYLTLTNNFGEEITVRIGLSEIYSNHPDVIDVNLNGENNTKQLISGIKTRIKSKARSHVETNVNEGFDEKANLNKNIINDYDAELNRIIFNQKTDLPTIQRAFASYWLKNNFKWARSGLASKEWLKQWDSVEKWLGVQPSDTILSVAAAKKFADAYAQYILEGKFAPELQWAFDGFQKTYQDIYNKAEKGYADLSEELAPEVIDWFNRSRDAAKNIMEKTYKDLANITMAAGVDVVTPVSNGTYVVSSMNDEGKITSDVVTAESAAKDSKLAKFRDKKSSSKVIEGLRKATNDNIPSSEYVVLNRAETVDQARQWITNDKVGAWNAMMDDNTNPIDRTSLFQAFKEIAENGDYELGKDLVNSKISAKITEMGQAISVLGERSEFDPLNILEMKQKAIGEPDVDTVAAEIDGMNLDAEHIRMTEEQVQEIKKQTECKL